VISIATFWIVAWITGYSEVILCLRQSWEINVFAETSRFPLGPRMRVWVQRGSGCCP